MRIRLKDGTVATLNEVRLLYEPPKPPVLRSDGRWVSRVVGTIRHDGPMTIAVTWPGFTARSSPDHPYFSVSRLDYVPAQELKVGEFLLNDQNEVVPVQAVSPVKFGMTELFNLEVEHFHNYYVGQPGGSAVLVHNSTKGPYINTPAEVVKKAGEYPIPENGMSIEARILQLVEINARRAVQKKPALEILAQAKENPSEWYYNTKSASYARRPAPAVDLSSAGLKREIPCFPGDVVVATLQGLLPIREIRSGTKVFAFDGYSKSVVCRRVLGVLNNSTNLFVHITIEGEQITTTQKHRFWEEKSQRWTPALELESGMVVRRMDGTTCPIIGLSTEKVSNQQTFNFTVEDCHNYFVGESGVLVHNGGEATHLVYFGFAPTDVEFTTAIYVGRTEDLLDRQYKHRVDAVVEPVKYGFKKGIVLRTQIDGLTLDQARFHEAAIYHRMADEGHEWGNLIEPLTQKRLARLQAQYC